MMYMNKTTIRQEKIIAAIKGRANAVKKSI